MDHEEYITKIIKLDLRSSLCNFINVYILVKEIITVAMK